MNRDENQQVARFVGILCCPFLHFISHFVILGIIHILCIARISKGVKMILITVYVLFVVCFQ